MQALGARERAGQTVADARQGAAAKRGVSRQRAAGALGAQAAGGRRAGRHGMGARGARPGRTSARRMACWLGQLG